MHFSVNGTFHVYPKYLQHSTFFSLDGGKLPQNGKVTFAICQNIISKIVMEHLSRVKLLFI